MRGCAKVCAVNAILVKPDNFPPKRLAYSPAEFAVACGRHPTWAYRLLYAGKLNAISETGRLLIPASEIEKLLGGARPYDPQRKTKKRKAAKSTEGGGGQ